MAKVAAKDANFTFNSVALESWIDSIEQQLKQEVPLVTGLGDAGPRRVVGNYDYGYALSGPNDFAASNLDATLFARIGAAGAATAFDPTGVTAGASDPNYDSTSVVLESYNIKAATGQGATYSAQLQGNAALARAVA